MKRRRGAFAMSMHDFEQALQLIAANAASADFAGPRPDQLISSAEYALGLTFPPTYRSFVGRLGAGAFGGDEFYGVITDGFENSSVPDAIWLTLKQRITSQSPRSLIFVSDTGDGAYYAIDVSQVTTDGESPIVEWWPGAPLGAIGNRKVIANDFGEFFLQQVQEALQRL